MDVRRLEPSLASSPPVSPLKPRRELVFKFLVVGDYGVGKTAIVRRYIEGRFTSNYKITIGADFSLKKVQWDPNTRVSIQLWDVAGHERFNYMTRVYYKYAVGCAIVFDITRQKTFQSVSKWLADIRDKVILDDGRDIPVILMANKWDIAEHCVSADHISKYCTQNNIAAWFHTSAKLNTNISESIMFLLKTVLDMVIPQDKPEDEETIRIGKRERERKLEEPCCR